VVFRGVYRNVSELDRSPVIPGRAKLAAALSMVLWISVVTSGRWIGYWEPSKPETPTARVN